MSDVINTPEGPRLYKFGKVDDEAIDAYHASDCLSRSKLEVFRHSPKLFWKKYIIKSLPKDEPSEALIVGQAIDTLSLEGEESFGTRFSVVPMDAPKRPTAAQRAIAAGGEVDSKGKPKKPSEAALRSVSFWDAWNAANKGKTALNSDQEALVKRCADALHSDEMFQMLMRGGKSQVTFRLQGENISIQCRPDRWCEDGNELSKGLPCILDVKSIAEMEADQHEDQESLTPEDNHIEDHLPKHIGKFGYHRAAFFYRECVANVEGYKNGYRPPFILCFVEKEEPHAVSCRPVSALAVDVGEREVRDGVNKLIWCIRNNTWPTSWNKPFEDVGLPDYYVRQALKKYGSGIEL